MSPLPAETGPVAGRQPIMGVLPVGFSPSLDMLLRLHAYVQGGPPQASAQQAPVVSPEQIARFAEAQVLGETSRALNVSPGVMLQTVGSHRPPPLPNDHVPRPGVLASIETRLQGHPILAVTGYEECGKTIAVAEFASATGTDCFWFATPAEVTDAPETLTALILSLAAFLPAGSITLAEVHNALEAFVGRRPLLLVLDNAHFFGDLRSLETLFHLARSANGRLKIILCASDEPAFMETVQKCAIPAWRLPGMTVAEASSLYERMGTDTIPVRKRALDLLCIRCDGHAGMLRLAAARIQRICDTDDLARYFGEVADLTASNVGQFYAALMSRFRDSLSAQAFQLCRRLAVALGPFRRRLAEALWNADQPASHFQQTWNQCVAGLLEAHDGARHSLPYLYHNGLRQYNSSAETQRWHSIAADTLGRPVGNAFDPFDVCDSVVHRLLSGDREGALRAACFFLAVAGRSRRRDTAAFLLRRLAFWVGKVADDTSVSRSVRLRWYTLRTWLCRDVAQRENADQAAMSLVSLLKGAPSVERAETDNVFGWVILLLHGSMFAQPELAVSALKALPAEYLGELDSEGRNGLAFLALSAFVVAHKNPLPLVHDLLRRPEEYKVPPIELWNEDRGYGLWRGVESSIYLAIDGEASRNRSAVDGEIARLRGAYEAAKSQGLPAVATLLGACLVRVEIDVIRDFKAACQLALEVVQLSKVNDPRLRAHAQHVLGDALRCDGQHGAAVAAYSAALELWPEPELFDRAQTTLLLGITLARLGELREALSFTREAARLHGIAESAPRAMAQALLEVAVIAMRLGRHPQALRSLVKAHSVLVDRHQDLPEWVVLAQCAWLLADTGERTKTAIDIPAPGFTLGLRDEIPGAEHMLPVAPTLMLARACSAYESPHRALAYFDRGLALIGNPDTRASTACLGLDPAINSDQLDRATKYAVLATTMPPVPAPGSEGMAFNSFLLDYIVARVVHLAIGVSESEEAVPRLDAAWKAGRTQVTTENEVTRILLGSLRALRDTLANRDPAPLEEAYQNAVGRGALFVARDLAWWWCFRFHVGRPRSTAEVLQWHWRLCWLTMEIGHSDDAFLERSLDQERLLWHRLRSAGDHPVVSEVCGVVDEEGESTRSKLSAVVSRLAIHVCEHLGPRAFVLDVQQALANSRDGSPVSSAVRHAIAKVLDVILAPGAAGILADIDELTQALAAAVDNSRGIDEATLTGWKSAIRRLRAILDALRTGNPTEAAFASLLSFAGETALLSPTSEANWYVWLRHSLGGATPDRSVFEKVTALLASGRAEELVRDSRVTRVIQQRLAVCHAAARGYIAFSRLASAGTLLAVQLKPGFPSGLGAVFRAERQRDDAIQAAEAAVRSLDQIERNLSSDEEVWSCSHERGGIRKLVGTLLCLQLGSPDLGAEWLRNAIADFRLAITMAVRIASPTLVLNSGTEALAIAAYLKDEKERTSLMEIVDTARASLGDESVVRSTDEAVSRDPLLTYGVRGDEVPDWPTDESQLQRAIDMILEASGLPEDRRPSIEDDVRKQVRTGQVQREFCKHLQPLQNLVHLESPATAYLLRTKYTCSCTLLGHKTAIEHDGIDVVIDAMQRVYCAGCVRREPRHP